MLCATALLRTSEEARTFLIRAAREGADGAELRLDAIPRPEVSALLPAKPLPVIVSVRPRGEGGEYEGAESDRFALLEEACRCGADWIDVEYRRFRIFPRHGAKLLLSHHDFTGVPADLEHLLQEMRALNPDLIKVAAHVRSMADVLRMLDLQKRNPGLVAMLPMGERGEALRILHPRFGGALDYAPLELRHATASGQIPLEVHRGLYRSGEIGPKTAVYGVIGDPVAHSRGPGLFNAAFASFGLDARYVRLPVDDPAYLRGVLDLFELAGASVTAPCKESILAAVDELDSDAREIGAVNTVVRKAGRWVGMNTDAPAVAEVLKRRRGDLQGTRVLVLGTGGLARAAAWALRREGAGVSVSGRDAERAKATEYAVLPWGSWSSKTFEVVINATSVGMDSRDDAIPGVEVLLHPGVVVLDAVYHPRRTALLQTAESKGAETVEGLELYFAQAKRQFEIWTDRDLPDSVPEV